MLYDGGSRGPERVHGLLRLRRRRRIRLSGKMMGCCSYCTFNMGRKKQSHVVKIRQNGLQSCQREKKKDNKSQIVSSRLVNPDGLLHRTTWREVTRNFGRGEAGGGRTSANQIDRRRLSPPAGSSC